MTKRQRPLTTPTTGVADFETSHKEVATKNGSTMKRFCLVFLVCLSGCADGTLPELNGVNPYLRRQWQQDLSFGPTFHEQVAELEQIQAHGGRLPPQEQQFRVQQLNELVRTSESPVLRAHSAKALAAIPLPEALQGINIAGADEDASVRIAACSAWLKRGGPEALSGLSELSKSDTELDVRMAAVRSLGELKDVAAIEALGAALDDRDPALQLQAIESLRKVSGREYGNDVAAWRAFTQGGNPVENPPSIAERFSNWLF